MSVASVALYAFSFLREVVTGARFGVSSSLDALYLAQAIPLFLASTVASVIQGTLVPLYNADAKPTDRLAFLNRAFTAVALLTLIMALFLALVSPWVVGWMGQDLAARESALAIQLVWVFLPFIPCFALAGLISAVFYSEKEFFLPGVLPAVAAAATIVAVWFGSAQWGVYALAIGIAAGAVLQLCIAWWLLARRGLRLRFTLDLHDARLRQMFVLSLPLLIGSATTGLVIIIDRTMAASLPPGSISALVYAEKLYGLALIAIGSVQIAVFPFFAEQASKGQYHTLRTDFKQTLSLICFVLAPVSALVILFNRTFVTLLLQRGSFTAEATIVTGQALVGYMVGLVPVSVGLICVRMAQSIQQNKLIGIAGALNPIWKVLLNLLFIPLFGILGVSLASSGMSALTALVLVVGIFRHWHARPTWRALWLFVKMSIAVLAMIGLAATLTFLSRAWFVNFGLELVLTGSICIASLGLYWGVCWRLDVEEARIVSKLGVLFYQRFLEARRRLHKEASV